MKNDENISIYKYKNVEIVDSNKFIDKLKKSKKFKEYIDLERERKDELKKLVENEQLSKLDENKFDYVKSINVINENGEIKNESIIYGQIFFINYKSNTLRIVDKKIYQGHFKIEREYKYDLEDTVFLENIEKAILNTINKISKKNNCDFLLYILANNYICLEGSDWRKTTAKDMRNLLKLWNITDKYYTYKKYKIYLNLYEEVYIDYLKNNSNIDLFKFTKIMEQKKEIKKKILKGE